MPPTLAQNLAALNPWVWTVTDLQPSYLQADTNAREALNNHIALQYGQIFIGNKKEDHIFHTNIASIEVPATGSAIVDIFDPNAITVTSISSKNIPELKIQTAGGDTYLLNAGQQLSIKKPGVPADYEPKKMPIMQAILALPEIVPKWIIFNSSPHHFYEHHTDVKPNNTTVIDDRKTLEKQIAAEPHFKDISYSNLKESQPIHIRKSAIAQIKEIEPNHYKLTRGSILLAEKHCVQVDTPQGRVLIKGNAIATITVRRNLTRVHNWHDTEKDSVITMCDKHMVSLRPGKEACMISTNGNSPDIESIVWADHLARRRLNVIPASDDKQFVLSDFSHLDAMGKEELLISLRASKNKADREIAAKLVKTGAAISYSRDRQREPYSLPFTPSAAESVAAIPNSVQ